VRAIAEDGPGALSLRDVARRLGVSHAAPTHHFGDKAGLLTAVAAEGFRLLARSSAEPTSERVIFARSEWPTSGSRSVIARISTSCSGPSCTTTTIPSSPRPPRSRRASSTVQPRSIRVPTPTVAGSWRRE
jgi:AcrR family transcriptional regulator